MTEVKDFFKNIGIVLIEMIPDILKEIFRRMEEKK